MTKLFPTLLYIIFSFSLYAEIGVKSFYKLENDKTASIEAPKKDHNSDVCAIIKVVTNLTGFEWYADEPGIVSSVYKNGEYWLYVPFGTRRITIQHPTLGVLRDYYYPIPIEKATVYEMVLTTGKENMAVVEATVSSGTSTISSAPVQSPVASNISETVTDIDGNVYHTITIGKQVWMSENLKTTRYCNGEPIPNIINNGDWKVLNSSAYCWYENNISNKSNFGALYNWYAVNDQRKIAPKGWHVPSDAEWTTLINYLGGDEVAGGKLKEPGTARWKNPNRVAIKQIGFSAVPGGNRWSEKGDFGAKGDCGFWWSSSEFESLDKAKLQSIINLFGSITYQIQSKKCGFSVRCIRDR